MVTFLLFSLFPICLVVLPQVRCGTWPASHGGLVVAYVLSGLREWQTSPQVAHHGRRSPRAPSGHLLGAALVCVLSAPIVAALPGVKSDRRRRSCWVVSSAWPNGYDARSPCPTRNCGWPDLKRGYNVVARLRRAHEPVRFTLPSPSWALLL
jgi:hypothetical protein